MTLKQALLSIGYFKAQTTDEASRGRQRESHSLHMGSRECTDFKDSKVEFHCSKVSFRAHVRRFRAAPDFDTRVATHFARSRAEEADASVCSFQMIPEQLGPH